MTTDMMVEDPRSLVRVLMRGDRQTGRRGEHGTAAVLAACRQHDIDAAQALEAKRLVAYAYGLAVALNEEPLDVHDALCVEHPAVVLEGWQDGCRENPERTLPAAVNA